MDSRLAALQQVILKKDLALLDLQTQLDAYRARYGELEPDGSDQREASAANPVAAAVAAGQSGGRHAKGDRQRPTSNMSSFSGWLTRATRAGSSSSPGLKPTAAAAAAPASSPAALKTVGGAQAAVEDGSTRAPVSWPSVASAPCVLEGEEEGVTRATGKNIVLDFVDDSPMFRRQLEGFDEALTGLRALLKELQARAKEYVGAGLRFGEDEAALAHELVARRHARALFTTSCAELGSLSSVFNQVHDTLAQVQSSRVSMLLSVEALLQHALEELSDQEIKDALEMRKEVARLGDEYETQLAKLLAKPRALSSASSSCATSADSAPSVGALASPSIGGLSAAMDAVASTGGAVAAATGTAASKQQRTLERDVLGARLRFELARFDLVRTLNRLEARKKVVLLECANSTLYALLGHFHAGHELLKAVEPALRERQEALRAAQLDLSADDAMWAAQRETLDLRLRSDLDRLLMASNGAATPSADAASVSSSNLLATAGAGCMPRSMDLPVEVVSRETWSSRYESRPEAPVPPLETRQEPLAETGDVVKQGFLFVRNSLFPARSWKRRWFQIHAGKLYQHRGGRQQHMDLVLVCDLLLARVREVGGDAAAASTSGASAVSISSSSSSSSSSPSLGASSSTGSGSGSLLPFCFEVIDASQARHLLQATSEREMRAWVDAAQRSTAAMLERQAHRMEVHPEQQAAVDALLARNPQCADCGARPADWVSINIGCLLCIECSGIHRSLGVHESKVRSLALDSWDMALLALLRDRLGNAAVNAAWEHRVPDGWAKPTPQAPREDKAKWITAKYHAHGFAEPVAVASAAVEGGDEVKRVVADRFLAAAARGDLEGLLWGLAHGVDVNGKQPKAERGAADGGESALHLAARAGDAECCEYLVLNGASLVAVDARGQTAAAAAAASGHERLARALAHKEEH